MKWLQLQVNNLARAVSDIFGFIPNLKHNTRESNSNDVRNETSSRFVRNNRQYSGIGSIPRLPIAREEKSRPSLNVVSLITVFAHPSSKFSGTGSLIENLATFHQAYVNTCHSFRLTNNKALDNLYILFLSGGEAGKYYLRYVHDRAKSLDETFYMLYDRFMSNERRDRLLQKWNNFNFNDFMKTPSTARHSGLQDLFSTSSSIQAQLGSSYQNDQHLRDAILNAFKNQTWSHRLPLMPTRWLVDIQESLTKAKSLEEELECMRSKKNQFPAFPRNVNFSRDWSGIPYRRYAENSGNSYRMEARQKSGKSLIEGAMRLLCRNCLSDEHLLRSCPEMTPAKRVRLTKHVLSINTVLSDLEKCRESLEQIQQFDADQWNDCLSAIKYSRENGLRPIFPLSQVIIQHKLWIKSKPHIPCP